MLHADDCDGDSDLVQQSGVCEELWVKCKNESNVLKFMITF